MPRRGPTPAKSGADRHGSRNTGDSGTAAACGDPDAASELAAQAAALSPELRDAVARLAAERDRLRDELVKARGRIVSLERLADEDALTPVANRRAFVRHLTRMIAFTHRYGVPAAIVYFDINRMKEINDMHGHPAGDAALRHIAEVLRENIRSSDIVGRLGGDEFGVILAQTDEEQARNKAVMLAEAIAGAPLRWGDLAIPISAAYGIYAFNGADDPQHALEAADRAMYRQKRAASPPEAAQSERI